MNYPNNRFIYVGYLYSHTQMSDEDTTIGVKEAIRDELRRYKAQDGLTYDEAIARLLEEAGWIEDEDKLLEDLE